MKYLKTTLVISASSLLATAALAQKPMSMESMAMDKKSMDTMSMGKKPEANTQGAHKATATVKKLDEKEGLVTLAHGPVASLNWPAMTMSFKVKDKSLLPKLAEGTKVDVEFSKQGDDYVVTSVK